VKSFQDALDKVDRDGITCRGACSHWSPECYGSFHDLYGYLEDPCHFVSECEEKTEQCRMCFGGLDINDPRCRICRFRDDCSEGQVPKGWPDCEIGCEECEVECPDARDKRLPVKFQKSADDMPAEEEAA